MGRETIAVVSPPAKSGTMPFNFARANITPTYARRAKSQPPPIGRKTAGENRYENGYARNRGFLRTSFEPFPQRIKAKEIAAATPDPILFTGAKVPGAGLEPARPRGLGILSPLCLPFHHPGIQKALTRGKGCEQAGKGAQGVGLAKRGTLKRAGRLTSGFICIWITNITERKRKKPPARLSMALG